MKYITVPQTPITICDINGVAVKRSEKEDVTLTFATFLRERITDKKFSEDTKGADAALLAFEVKCALDDQKELLNTPAAIVTLENEQYKRILAATNEPEAGYNPVFQHNFVPFIKAIRDAKDSK